MLMSVLLAHGQFILKTCIRYSDGSSICESAMNLHVLGVDAQPCFSGHPDST